MYINGNSMRCKQCASYKVDEHYEKGQWWDGFCYNKEHCKTHKTKCPAKVIGDLMACFNAERRV